MTVLVSSSAADLLCAAQDRVYRWPAGFRGFAARLRVGTESGRFTGLVWVTGFHGLALDLEEGAGEEEWEWADEQLRCLVRHRWPLGPPDTEPSFGVTHHDESTFHPEIGRESLLVVDDPMHSTYRIRDGRMVEIIRTLPTLRLRVLIREHTPAPAGRWLPRLSTTILSDLSGTVRSVDMVTESWQLAGPLVWPKRREVVTVTGPSAVVRTLELTDHHELLPWRDQPDPAEL